MTLGFRLIPTMNNSSAIPNCDKVRIISVDCITFSREGLTIIPVII